MDNITLTDEHLKQAREVVTQMHLAMSDREIVAMLRDIAIWNPPSLIDQFRAELEQLNSKPTTN